MLEVPGVPVELFRDDAEGYHLNLTSLAPCWFVLWRLDEDPGTGAIPLARPVEVSLSYLPTLAAGWTRRKP